MIQRGPRLYRSGGRYVGALVLVTVVSIAAAAAVELREPLSVTGSTGQTYAIGAEGKTMVIPR